jgi:hypothetical protein
MTNKASASDQFLSTQSDPDCVGCVYFWGLRNRRIKIGHTLHPDMRVRSLRYQFSLPSVGFLALTTGSRADEAAYHERFKAHRPGKSEWFEPHAEILAEIDRLNAHGARNAGPGA